MKPTVNSMSNMMYDNMITMTTWASMNNMTSHDSDEQRDDMTTWQHEQTWQHDNYDNMNNMWASRTQHGDSSQTTVTTWQHYYSMNSMTNMMYDNMTIWQHDNYDKAYDYNDEHDTTWQHDENDIWQHDKHVLAKHDNMMTMAWIIWQHY
jgi:hypothetical protein